MGSIDIQNMNGDTCKQSSKVPDGGHGGLPSFSSYLRGKRRRHGQELPLAHHCLLLPRLPD